ncbi:enolase C-terminal domain-like protein [Xylariaceae sp. FL1651]|nr:enolase C-terminal domain-like protein [Xylariaceae sp. FL1651]
MSGQLSYRCGFYMGGPVPMGALSRVDIALWDLKARKLGIPIYQLLGGKIRDKLRLYAWISGDRPSDVERFNASPDKLDDCVERVKVVRALGLDAGVDFHGRIHKPIAKELLAKLAPYEPFFIEELFEREREHWRHRGNSCADTIAHRSISEMRRIATSCEMYDVALAPRCPLVPVVLATAVQFNAAKVSMGRDEYIDFMSGPGLGIEVDEDRVRRLSEELERLGEPEYFRPGNELREQ